MVLWVPGTPLTSRFATLELSYRTERYERTSDDRAGAMMYTFRGCNGMETFCGKSPLRCLVTHHLNRPALFRSTPSQLARG